jgi:predicted peroxiredoxin
MLACACAAVLLVLTSLPTGAQDDSPRSLFINLTSDQMNRAAMALHLANLAMTGEHMEVTIFLNVEGVFLGDKKMPQLIHPDGKTLHEMLGECMANGAKVYVCPMCMKNLGGLVADDMLPGIMIADESSIWPKLFAEQVRVLSY